jgi:N,N'-diacetyllegionaminate synthase
MIPIEVGGRRVGEGAPCFVIAEAGVNHNGDLALAHRLVAAAQAAGADAVKFQTFDPALLAGPQAPRAAYQELGDPGSTSQREMLERLALSREAHKSLQTDAADRGLVFLSSPFDEGSADFLDQLGVPAFKIPSGEVTNRGLLDHLARKGKPLLLSTGMCTLEEVGAALGWIRSAGDPPVLLLHCVSSYPADAVDANLRALDTLRRTFGVPVGWSDHTLGLTVALAAVAREACVLEKHLTLDRSLPGPDHRASLEPDDFAEMIRQVRIVESSLGSGVKEPRAAEGEIARVARKSLHLRTALAAGIALEAGHLLAQRPGTGLSPARLPELLGRRLRRNLPAGACLQEEDLEAE